MSLVWPTDWHLAPMPIRFDRPPSMSSFPKKERDSYNVISHPIHTLWLYQ